MSRTPSSEVEHTIKRKARVGKRALDLESITIFPASEVPPPSRVRTPFRELLRKIGKGQATCLSENQINLGTAYSAIKKLQEQGEFKNFNVTRRTVDGEKRLYIINEEVKSERI